MFGGRAPGAYTHKASEERLPYLVVINNNDWKLVFHKLDWWLITEEFQQLNQNNFCASFFDALENCFFFPGTVGGG